MHWVPLWNEILQNRKVQSLPAEMFKAWINILCLASQRDEDGNLPCVEDIGFALRIDDGRMAEIAEQLVAKKLLDRTESGFTIHHWSDWQLPSYSSTERVKRFRERKKQQDGNDSVASRNGDETLQERSGNGCETDEKRVVTALELEGEKTPPIVPPRGEVVSCNVTETFHEIAKPKKPPAIAIPDWVPADDWSDFIAMRTKIRKPMTERAKSLIVKELDKLRSQGHAPGIVLQQSIRNCWQDVFAIRGNPGSPPTASAEPKFFDAEAYIKSLKDSPIL